MRLSIAARIVKNRLICRSCETEEPGNWGAARGLHPVGTRIVRGGNWWLGAIVTLGLMVPLSFAVSGTGTPAVSKPVPPMQASTTSRTGEAKADLGVRPLGFGSTAQARELLTLIKGNPGKAMYTITYRTEADVVVFGCDINTGVLVRVHQEPSKGRSETWTGYLVERLQSAARGGSLNDTPAGKSFAVDRSY